MNDLFERYEMIVAVMAIGILVRLLCPLLRDKWTDRAVVAVDSSLRSVIPLIGGHHGANDLAIHLSKRLGAYPAVTTATDSAGRLSVEKVASALRAEIINKESTKCINVSFLNQDVPILRLKGPEIVIVDDDVAVLRSGKGIVVGIGARRGTKSEEIVSAIRSAIGEAGRSVSEIKVIATSRIKIGDEEIARAAEMLGASVVYLTDEALNSQRPESPSRAMMLGLSGVAEPAVLALAERIILPKKIYGRVTVALGE